MIIHELLKNMIARWLRYSKAAYLIHMNSSAAGWKEQRIEKLKGAKSNPWATHLPTCLSCMLCCTHVGRVVAALEPTRARNIALSQPSNDGHPLKNLACRLRVWIVEVETEAAEALWRNVSQWMSPKYNSNMNSRYNSLIHSEVHMTLSVTISNVGHINCHSRSHRHFQHRTAKVLFHSHPNRNTSMT